MVAHDPYVAKGVEYVLGLVFLLLFAGYWRYVMHDVTASAVRAPVEAPAARVADPMFRVPDGVLLHPGHAWARAVGEPDLVAVGLDDFAQQLIGPIRKVLVPHIGARVDQGAAAMTLEADSKLVNVLSPVSGHVVAVNADALHAPRTVNEDPYGDGWLVKVAAPRLAIDRKQLAGGRSAQRLMSASWEELAGLLSPELGTIMHDGGTPVQGFARALDPAGWDDIARRFLLN
jgi:glycine cleavage system H lipoate-binding protein